MKYLFKFLLATAFCAINVLNGADLIVKTYPDGARDDKTAYLLTNSTVPVSFYIFSAKDPKILLEQPVLSLTMPASVKLLNYSEFNNGRNLKSTDKIYPAPKALRNNKYNSYSITCGKSRRPLNIFKPTKWTIYSTYHIYAFINIPQNVQGREFDIKWQLSDKGKSALSGIIKVKAVPPRKLKSFPKSFMLWSGLGYTNGLLTKNGLLSYLQIMKSFGVTHIINEGLPWKNSNRLLSSETINAIRAEKFGLVDRNAMSKAFRPHVWNLKKQIDLKDEYFYVNLAQKRGKQPVCPSFTIKDGGSTMLHQACKQIIKDYNNGYRWFFYDYEQHVYFMCYCKECRLAFANFLQKDRSFIMSAKPLELIHKYPLEWYKFRSVQTSRTMTLMRKIVKSSCPEAKLGLNDVFAFPWANIQGLGRGAPMFAEDPRIIDPGVDFHNSDTIKGGLSDIVINKLYFDKNTWYYGKITKPLIARSGSFCDINWNYFCVLGRVAWAKKQNGKFGCDKRPELLKLAVANNAANGAVGAEVTLSPDVTDALCYNELSKSVEYISQYEDILDRKNILPDSAVKVWNLTTEVSPYHKIGTTNYYDRMYFYGPAQKFGVIQYTIHKKNEEYLISLFNWDLYQAKKLKVAVASAGKTKYYVTAYIDAKNFIICSKTGKKAWTGTEIKNGISLQIPAGGITAVKISPDSPRNQADSINDPEFKVPSGLQPVDLNAWMGNDAPSLKPFKMMIYNLELKRLQGKFNIPQKYLFKFSNVYAGSWLVPVDRGTKLLKPTAEIVTDPTKAKDGTKSIKITYHHSLNKMSREDTSINLRSVFPGKTVKIICWVYSDGSNNPFTLSLRDSKGEHFQYSCDDAKNSRLNWKGWKKLEWTLPRKWKKRSFGGAKNYRGKFDFPVSSFGFVIMAQGSKNTTNTIWLSGIKAVDKDFKDWPVLF
jgi:hypothetical protein